MRPHVVDFLKVCINHLDLKGPILEVGSLQVLGQDPDPAELRPLFPGYDYTGIDLNEGPGVDKVMDASSMPYGDGYFGTVLMMEVIEMCPFPVKTVDEVYRVLSPEGVLIMSSIGPSWGVESWPLDYWRATPLAYKDVLLRNFEAKIVDWGGREAELPSTIVAVGLKKEPANFPVLKSILGNTQPKYFR